MDEVREDILVYLDSEPVLESRRKIPLDEAHIHLNPGHTKAVIGLLQPTDLYKVEGTADRYYIFANVDIEKLVDNPSFRDNPTNQEKFLYNCFAETGQVTTHIDLYLIGTSSAGGGNGETQELSEKVKYSDRKQEILARALNNLFSKINLSQNPSCKTLTERVGKILANRERRKELGITIDEIIEAAKGGEDYESLLNPEVTSSVPT